VHREFLGKLADESRLDEPPWLVAPSGPRIREIDPESRNGVVVKGLPNDPRGVDADQPDVAELGPGQPPGQFENPLERNLDTDERSVGAPVRQLGQKLALPESDVDVETQRGTDGKIE
jgi:hypothetical protein